MSEIIGYAPPEQLKSALRPFRVDPRVLQSPFASVSHEQWTDFVFCMRVQNLGDTSKSNGVGMFDFRYKRLADLGLVKNVRYKFDPVIKRSVQIADWGCAKNKNGELITQDKFLGSAEDQYEYFVRSMKDYARQIVGGKLTLSPGVSMSGALAILHRCGRSGLAKCDKLFPSTKALFDRTNGVF